MAIDPNTGYDKDEIPPDIDLRQYNQDFDGEKYDLPKFTGYNKRWVVTQTNDPEDDVLRVHTYNIIGLRDSGYDDDDDPGVPDLITIDEVTTEKGRVYHLPTYHFIDIPNADALKQLLLKQPVVTN